MICVLLALLLTGLVACSGGVAAPAAGRAPAPTPAPAAPAATVPAAQGEGASAVGRNGAPSAAALPAGAPSGASLPSAAPGGASLPPAAPSGAPLPPAAAVAQELGPLVATPLDVPARLRAEAFRQPHTLNLPRGFRAQLFAAGLAGPRLMAFDEQGVLHVTLTRAGSVVALPDRDGDGVADAVVAVRE